MNKGNKIAITGASGFIGRNVGQFLAKNGYEVVSILRKRKKKVVNFGRMVSSEDLTENDLISSVRGSIALLHFIGKGKQTIDSDYETVNFGLTRNAIRLCKLANIKKILYISGLGVDEKSKSGYFISKFKAEREIIKSGLNYTIFRSSYIVGNDDPLSKILNKQIIRNLICIPGSGNYRLQPIFVEDVARIVMKSITQKQFSNKIIDLVGPKTVTYKQFVRDFLQGRKIKIRNVNFEQVYYDAIHCKNNQFGEDDLGILVGNYVGNYKRLAKISGIEFTKYNKMLKSCSLS